ncbi:SHOCT domain-containing protein [Salinarchaeum laminariae]|uniref:SHOCT domain-containing protein n=1 Tax=Salinarchaeum laminariae TaxID=869888 RepID=UPI0020C0ABCC|nr:SHOCT domain-containing protein [Salinarchaeum laminariae]
MDSDDVLLRTVVVVVTAVLLVPVLLMLVTVPMMGGMGGGHMMADGGWQGSDAGWAGLGMWVVMLALVGGIGYVLFGAVRRTTTDASDPAIEELRVAYARGELSEGEFEERRERLETDG